MAKPMKEVLLVGLGAVGALCEHITDPYNTLSTHFVCLDSLIFKRSGLARVTAVARSNYSIVQGAFEFPCTIE